MALDPATLALTAERTARKTRREYPIVEKDYWVVWLLDLLFSGPYANQLTFKGGTSLSKAYKVIDRFSEDVDLIIDRGLIDLDPDKSLEVPDLGRAQRTKRSKAFNDSVTTFITGEFAPWLNDEIQKRLVGRKGDTAPALRVDKEDSLNLFFDYPRSPDAKEDIYIKPFVRLEFGARGDRAPQIQTSVQSYIEEEYPEIFAGKTAVQINVLAMERTFWEKITILHSVCCRPEEKPPRDRFFRHYYDVYHLAQDKDFIESAIENSILLAEIVENKRIYFFESWDWYPTAKRGSFKLVPSAAQQEFLAKDYLDMQDMIFGSKPSFSEIMATLKNLEEKINAI